LVDVRRVWRAERGDPQAVVSTFADKEDVAAALVGMRLLLVAAAVPKAITYVCFILASSRASLHDERSGGPKAGRMLGETGSAWPAGPVPIARCNAKASD